MTQTLIDRYRCPEQFVPFEAMSQLSPNPGFFRFGPDTICFGRCHGIRPADEVNKGLCDLAGIVPVNGSSTLLPFDLDEVIENLRRENYTRAQESGAGLINRAVNRAYYVVRPALGVRLRKHLQRWRLRDWESIPFPEWPVDHSVENVMEAMLRLALKKPGVDCIPFVWYWPDGAAAAAMLTHDVETAAGRDFCSSLMNIMEGYGIKSSFQIIPEKRYQITPAFLAEIRNRGFELNVHDLNHDGNLFRDRSEFLNRAQKINHYSRALGARGFRAAVLYRNSEWLQALDFSYDMSVPNVAHLDPQRGGCCTVMPYFIGHILELPVTLTQDYTLFHVLNDYSTRLWDQQMDIIMANHGLMSFIIHPDYLLESRPRGVVLQLLQKLVRLRSEQNVWLAQPGEVDQWWRQRQRMSVDSKDGHWVLEGPGKERARIAYAHLEEDRIVYTVESSTYVTQAA